MYIVGDCVIDESKKAFLLLLQWSWYSKIRGRSLLGLCSTKKINGIWSKIFHFGYSIFVTDFMGLLLHPVYVFWCISAYFNGYIDLKRDNGVTPPNVSGWFKIKMAASFDIVISVISCLFVWFNISFLASKILLSRLVSDHNSLKISKMSFGSSSKSDQNGLILSN